MGAKLLKSNRKNVFIWAVIDLFSGKKDIIHIFEREMDFFVIG